MKSREGEQWEWLECYITHTGKQGEASLSAGGWRQPTKSDECRCETRQRVELNEQHRRGFVIAWWSRNVMSHMRGWMIIEALKNFWSLSITRKKVQVESYGAGILAGNEFSRSLIVDSWSICPLSAVGGQRVARGQNLLQFTSDCDQILIQWYFKIVIFLISYDKNYFQNLCTYLVSNSSNIETPLIIICFWNGCWKLHIINWKMSWST